MQVSMDREILAARAREATHNIELARAAMAAWSDERHAAINEMQAAGMSLREIGEAVGLSHGRIAQLLKGSE